MSRLFSPLTLRDVTFKNRIAVSPMSQYRAVDGYASPWHMVHLGRLAMGGAGLVYAEATAVTRDGRRTHGDLGLWQDEQIDGLKAITEFLSAEGTVPGVQLGHAGRKASERRPWHNETPVDDEDIKLRGEAPWPAVAPSAIPYADGWHLPLEMSQADIEQCIDDFGAAASRARQAGFRIIEVYAAHGFLVHQFLSPIAHKRTDQWGGSLEDGMRFGVEVARSIRKNWPDDLPLAFRLSATDWLDGGLEIEDTIRVCSALKAAGVDMIDVSTGGIGGKERPRRMEIRQGFQTPFAKDIKSAAEIATMSVGFIWDAEYCEQLISEASIDMVALGRELLVNPNWPLQAAQVLGVNQNHEMAPIEVGWWLMKRDKLVKKLGLR